MVTTPSPSFYLLLPHHTQCIRFSLLLIVLYLSSRRNTLYSPMWSAIRLSPIRRLRAPGRALSSSFTRGRANPRGPRNSIRRPEPIPNSGREGAQSPHPESSNGETSNPAANYDPSQNTLLSPVHIPEDPNAVLKENHPATGLLANSGLVVQRQIELMNVMM